jgi:hypothetical protein
MSLPHPSVREFTTKDTTLVVKYLRAKNKYLHDHNFYCRLRLLKENDDADHPLAERLDKVWVAASLYAAKLCRSRRRAWWSVPLNQAIEKKDLLRTCVTCFRTATDLFSVIRDRMTKFKLHFPIPASLEAANVALRAAQKEIKEIRNNSKSYRAQSMLDQAHELAASGNLDHAKILEQMRNKERQAERWKRIHFLQGNNLKGQFSQVEVPSTWPSTEEEFLQNDIENPRTCTDWKTIDDPSEMEFYLQMRNRRHFGQAHGTPFTVSPLSQDINWSATSPDSEKILSGD